MKKDLLSLADLTSDELWHLLNVAQELKDEWKGGGNQPILTGKTLAMIFQKPSLRTRVSFEMAMHHLGGKAMYLSPEEIQLGKRETVPDVARVLSRFVDCIMARVFSHNDVKTLATFSRVPVINGLSDYSHPCQGLGDLLTIVEHKGNLRGLKLAWCGDGNNVLTSLLFGASRLGIDVSVATPVGYEPPSDVLEIAFRFAQEHNSQIEIGHNPKIAVRGADVIYTDVWTSMGQEAEKEQRLRVFPPYQVNAALLAEAKSDVIVMHCLPAHRGEEITDEVADGPHSVLWDQAENRMHAQKAVLAVLLANK
ncbi:MAG TPA: ornithine carbamoyltransferase [Anaerolineae bacterium]|nr:ornithine carbamoyltransferase [Anaerolineae bacterium]HNT05295.1 ornithine carbamoyltransferase [Anaerolineae bacterium]